MSITEHNNINKSDEEMRGLWVSYLSLDMQNTDKSFESFKEKFADIISEAKRLKCNTLIVQVRPFCDALYNSEIFPNSHILTGVQGASLDYDALEYMCEATHKNELKIHAWVNPLRVKLSNSTFDLSENNPYVINNELGLETESGIFLNPAKKEARNLIIDGIKEIITNYSVDGIQFDDYFYPEDIDTEDEKYYLEYTNTVNSTYTPLSLGEWRKNNINILVAETYLAIKNIDRNILFGISPQGNIENNKHIYADVEEWCKIEGYLDYICPQLYYSLENPHLPFEEALKNWSDLAYHENIKVYIGLAAYKAGSNEDEGTWKSSDSILKEELNLLRRYKFDGFMLYEYKSLKNTEGKEEFNNLRNIV